MRVMSLRCKFVSVASQKAATQLHRPYFFAAEAGGKTPVGTKPENHGVPERLLTTKKHPQGRQASHSKDEAVESREEGGKAEREQLPVAVIVIAFFLLACRAIFDHAQDMHRQTLAEWMTGGLSGEDEGSGSHSKVLTQNLPFGPTENMVNFDLSRHGTCLTVSCK